MPGMKLSEYLNQLERGGKSAFARRIGAHASDLSDWMKGARPIPVRFCPAIERESGGVVGRKECRPKDWQLYWPELATQVTDDAHAEAFHG
ncbi:transcriptional regulator [Comamonas terrae]|uniref:Transcriptional regulator n=1 Tax=Comamonas terrae TaxID=673548 RepID=A0ABW5UT92_9BURK|nr:YdaS family helix-turn-helix protein [Comamonas terrae]